MRRNPATVVALAGHASEPLLGAVSGSMNVALMAARMSDSLGMIGIITVQPATGAWLGRLAAADGSTTDRSG